MAAKVPLRTRKAEQNNDSLFPLFLRHLKSDNLKDYTTTAEKLASWLRVDRAYYLKARPVIVEMLETAHDNLCRQTGLPRPFHVTQANPCSQVWAKPFVSLVHTVVPFYPLFREELLQLRLRDIIKTICIGVTVDHFLSQQALVRRSSAVTSEQGSPNPAPALLPQGAIPQDPTSVSAFSSVAPSPSAPSSFAPSVSNLPPVTLDVPNKAGIPSPISVTPIAQVAASVPIPPPASAAMPSQSSKPVKAKRKLVIDDDDYIQADLNWFKDNHQATGHSSDGAPIPVAASSDQSVTTPVTLNTDDQPPHKQSRIGSPTVPLQEVTDTDAQFPSCSQPKTKESSPPKESSVDKSNAPCVPQATPGSPPSLPPPIQKQPSPERQLVMLISPPTKAETLPSPFANKKAFVKKRGKGKGPPGLKVLPINPGHLQDLGEKALVKSDIPVVASSLVAAVSPEVTHTSTSENVSAPPATVSIPHHKPSPPSSPARVSLPPCPLPASPPFPADSDASVGAVTTKDPSADRKSPSDVAGSLIPETSASPVSAVLNDTAAIVASPEPMDLGPDEPEQPATSLDDGIVTVEEVHSPVQEDPLPCDRDVQSQPVTSSNDCIGDNMRPPVQEGQTDVEMQEPSPVEAVSSSINQGHVADLHGNEAQDAMPPPNKPDPKESNNDTNDLPAPGMARDDVDSSLSPFLHNCIRLLSLTRGHSSYTPVQQPVDLAFTLTTEEVAQITRWRDRDTITGDLSESMCISLVCYSTSQCTTLFAHGRSMQFPADVVQCGQPAKWPTDASVFAVLEPPGHDRPSRSFTLSPPFTQCEPDRTVDLGARGVHSGVNTLRVLQYRDHSDVAFAVVLHHPTAAQLAELQRLRDQDRSWHQFLDGLGTFTLPVPTLTTPALPKVNPVSGS